MNIILIRINIMYNMKKQILLDEKNMFFSVRNKLYFNKILILEHYF